MADSRLFPIVGEPARLFYAGSLPGGRQALISRSLSGDIVMAVFGPKGQLLKVVRRELPSPPVVPGSGDYRDVEEDVFARYLGEQFGFSPRMIRVKEFRLPEDGLAVYQRPKLYQEFLSNPAASQFNDGDRLELPAVIAAWDDSGQFVLEVGRCDYWLGQTGEVVGS
jgi:hypothetical protein